MTREYQFAAVELWAGPLDGEWVEAIPDIPVVAYQNDLSDRVQWSPFHLNANEETMHWRIIGFYTRCDDAHRRIWRPAPF